MHTFIEKNERLCKVIGVALALFLVAAFFVKLREYRFVGSGVGATSTITVTGEGKVERSPDTAKISFTIRNEQKALTDAQQQVSTKVDAIKAALLDAGLEEKYIKTDSYTSYPQYDYPQITCYRTPCPSSAVLRGYEVSHAITLSIKDLDKVESILGILGTNSVTDLSGPSFGFEDDKAVSREARALAIADAKAEAKVLTKSLGVRLGRVVSFSESGNGVPMPMYAKEMMAADSASGAAAPSVPMGVQNVQSSVTVVYEIR